MGRSWHTLVNLIKPRKWAAILAVIAVTLLAGVTILRRCVILPTFAALEQREAGKDLVRCLSAIDAELGHLDNMTGDWAAWDDTYKFLQDRNQEYADANLVWTTLEGQSELNLLYICGLDGTVAWGEIYDSTRGGPLTTPELDGKGLGHDSPLLRHGASDSLIHGVLKTQLGPMLISSRPVVTSRNEGPVRGSLIMGRFLTDKEVRRLGEQAQVRLAVVDPEGPDATEDERRLGASLTVGSALLKTRTFCR